MICNENNKDRTAIGQMALHQVLAAKLPPPAVQSFVVSGARRTLELGDVTEELYPRDYLTDGTVLGNLRFAFRHEPLDLRILYAIFETVGGENVAFWVRAEPTGAFSRRVWFFYETLIGVRLDIESAKSGNYVNALDINLQFTSLNINSPRHRVRDNLLGSNELCPTVRRTPKIEAYLKEGLKNEAQKISDRYSPEILERASNFMFTKETRSSFALEGVKPDKSREARFLLALHSVNDFDPIEKSDILELQNLIVEPRYAASDWRNIQNYVGETTRGFGEFVHFICPKPEDIERLMEGWRGLAERQLANDIDPVIAAAVVSFAFVFIHPFEDGNGRIHRFLIHSILSRRRFLPDSGILPVSIAILREKKKYDKALEAFSKSIMPSIEWDFVEDNAIAVHNDTRHLYRFFDATTQVEFLFERIAETIRVDFKKEMDFLEMFDKALTAVREIVEMPDRRASLLVRFILQNEEALPKNRRNQFPELTDEEIDLIESGMRE